MSATPPGPTLKVGPAPPYVPTALASGSTGACRVRHRAGNDPPAPRRVDRTRARCLALFSFDEKVPGTAPIAFLGARNGPSKPRCRPPACHRRGRSPTRCHRATAPMGRRWDARGTNRGGPEGRRSRTPCNADRSRAPARPAASRTRDHNLDETDGQAGRPPPQYGPDGRRRERDRDRARQGRRRGRGPSGADADAGTDA